MDTRRESPATGASLTDQPQRLYLSTLLKRAVIDAGGQSVGHLADVIIRQRGNDPPLVTGLVADMAGRHLFIPAEAVVAWESDRLALASAQVDLRQFERRAGEIMLRADVLDHRLVDATNARLVHAADVQLTRSERGWQASGIDVHRVGRLHLSRSHEHHAVRDWNEFALVGGRAPVTLRARRAWLRRLKPAEIADLLEEASDEERTDILAQVHSDRELEADVFEELEEDEQSELLGLRSDAEVAEVLSRMQADDVADAIMELPSERRLPILELLPTAKRTKVTMLLGFHAASAGGLMGVDFVALPGDASVSDALVEIARATRLQPQALTSVYCSDEQGRLAGVVTLVQLVQVDSPATLGTIADADPIRVEAGADLLTVTLLMADHNLLTLPVVDAQGLMIGLITVDDVLEGLVPDQWRRRVPEPRRHGRTADVASPHTDR